MLILVTTVGIFTFTDYPSFRIFKNDLGLNYAQTFFALAHDFAD